MDMEDEKGGDAKLIAVVASEPRTLSIIDIHDVPLHVKSEIQQFFELYKSLESKPGKPKWVRIRAWGDRSEALRELADSIAMFEAEKKPTSEVPQPVGNVYELTPDLCELPADAPPGVVSAYVEVMRGDANKYEWDCTTGFLTLDRVLHSSIFYPGDYGFIPRTLCGDGDPIDVVVLSSYPLRPGRTLTRARPPAPSLAPARPLVHHTYLPTLPPSLPPSPPPSDSLRQGSCAAWEHCVFSFYRICPLTTESVL